jgi:hypothetical protein
MDGPLVPFAAQYGHVARRRRPNKAAVAGAPSMVVAAWHILTTATISTTSAPTTSTPHDPGPRPTKTGRFRGSWLAGHGRPRRLGHLVTTSARGLARRAQRTKMTIFDALPALA